MVKADIPDIHAESVEELREAFDLFAKGASEYCCSLKRSPGKYVASSRIFFEVTAGQGRAQTDLPADESDTAAVFTRTVVNWQPGKA